MKFKRSPIISLFANAQPLVDTLAGIIWKLQHGVKLSDTEWDLVRKIGDAETDIDC